MRYREFRQLRSGLFATINRRRQDMKTFWIGMSIGVGIGILIAPSSGESTREMIRDRIGQIKESAAGAARKTASGDAAPELASPVADNA